MAGTILGMESLLLAMLVGADRTHNEVRQFEPWSSANRRSDGGRHNGRIRCCLLSRGTSPGNHHPDHGPCVAAIGNRVAGNDARVAGGAGTRGTGNTADATDREGPAHLAWA